MSRGQMKTWAECAALVVALVAGVGVAQGDTRDPRGLWQGKLMGTLTLVCHVGGEPGALVASVDSPDQGAMGLAVTTATFAGDTLRLVLTDPEAEFIGRMSADGQRLEGEWRQGGRAIPLSLARGSANAPPPMPVAHPQEPHPPYPYATEEVRYPGGGPGVTLVGTLTRPNGAGPFPCALMITGSGPQDRDEALLGHKPFFVIADHLTRAGIAVLRVDDRGTGESTGRFATATSEDFTADALAGVEYLKTRPDIDPKHIGLIGHSEGALIAPLAATRSHDVAFIVMLAGPGVTGAEILDAQGEAMSRANGGTEARIALQRRVQKRLFALARTDVDSVTAAARVHAIFREEGVDSAMAASQAAGAIELVRSPWFRFFLDYDPRPALRRVTCPVLALNGSKDTQVVARQNLPEIELALHAGGNRDVDIRELPGLNHLFQTCTTGSPLEYAKIAETFAPAALDTMTAWVRARTAGERLAR